MGNTYFGSIKTVNCTINGLDWLKLTLCLVVLSVANSKIDSMIRRRRERERTAATVREKERTAATARTRVCRGFMAERGGGIGGARALGFSSPRTSLRRTAASSESVAAINPSPEFVATPINPRPQPPPLSMMTCPKLL